MKTDLVHTIKNMIYTDSKTVSELLEVDHSTLLRTVEKIVKRYKNNPQVSALKFPPVFKETVFLNKMGRSYRMYEMNEQAYMKLAMQLTGYKKAEIVQDLIIDAFSMMKQALLNNQNATWLNKRNEGTQIRSQETDVIQNFVEYATNQGSKSAKMYYSNITRMTNKALELLIQVPDGKPIRDLATITELGFIQVVDNRAMQAILYGMVQNLPYKYIYRYAKDEVNNLVAQLNFKGKLL